MSETIGIHHVTMKWKEKTIDNILYRYFYTLEFKSYVFVL